MRAAYAKCMLQRHNSVTKFLGHVLSDPSSNAVMQALAQRKAGMAAPLKNFHNKIKRWLIQRFAKDCDALLDLACGRGGDLLKWVDAGVKYAHGFDIAAEEVC
jgi:mRNA (guanine-N7-)-methyltransferase